MGVDPWVPSTIHIFNQIGTGEWPLGPVVEVDVVLDILCHMTTEVPPLVAAPGGGYLLTNSFCCGAAVPLGGISPAHQQCIPPLSSAHLLSTCAFHHGCPVSGGSHGARSG